MPDRDLIDHHTHVIGEQMNPGYAPPSASLSPPAGDAGKFADEQAADKACRREWAAAVRWFATRTFTEANARNWHAIADMIEAGKLTPWADQPEPPAPPAVPSGAAPAAAGPHPDTPDGWEALQRAEGLMRARLAEAWPHLAEDPVFLEQLVYQAAWSIRGLLVSPAAGRVLDAARELVVRRRDPTVTDGDQARAEAWLWEAVDALDAGQPAGPCPTCSGPGRVTVGMVCQTCGTDYGAPAESAPGRCDCGAVDHAIGETCPATEPAPEPDSGPGWDRNAVWHIIAWHRDDPDKRNPETAEQLEGLLASYDDAAEQIAELRGLLAARITERNAARAELAEVTADRDRLRREWADADAVAQDYGNRLDACAAELATARRDAERWEQAAGDMEARERHAAADALEMVRAEFAQSINDGDGDLDPGWWQMWLETMAAEVRNGTRPAPGSRQPATAGGEAAA